MSCSCIYQAHGFIIYLDWLSHDFYQQTETRFMCPKMADHNYSIKLNDIIILQYKLMCILYIIYRYIYNPNALNKRI